MISTPLEDKWRAFLYDHIGATDSTYDTLDFIEKVYTDQPRKDVDPDNFPRLKVTELPSPSTMVHRTSVREYDANLSIQIFVNNDTPLTIKTVTASPEVACARIGYKIIDCINDYWQTGLFTGDEFYVKTMSYNRMGIDNEYFKKLDVYKGAVEINGIYWR